MFKVVLGQLSGSTDAAVCRWIYLVGNLDMDEENGVDDPTQLNLNLTTKSCDEREI